ncbi:MAG: antifreeze protein [Desulfobacteraceae bacterium 4572_88]|nr:MAG: antifreeze protein [Desulfobacteraceae bacterium 4572_88]
MGLWDRFKSELIDIIEWSESQRDTMVWRFERHDNEIKYGAQLIVREGQEAVFINEGQLGDVFTPGTHTLETRNLPVLSTLKGWKYGFESPFKAEVYFVSTRQFTELKWGLKNPLMLRDPEFGPLRIRAFGTYSIRVYDSASFIREIVGTDGHFTTYGISNQLRDLVVARFSDALGESKIPVLDLAANYDELGSFMEAKIGHEFGAYGLELTKLLIGSISLPPAVEEALDKRASMGVIGNLGAYTQYQTAEAIRKAAETPGGGAGEAMGMGAGFAMANQMAKNMAQTNQPQAQSAPPPIPQEELFHVAMGGKAAGPYNMTALKQQAQSGQVTRDMLVWKDGMAQWMSAGDVPELASLFSSIPPPIPPA